MSLDDSCMVIEDDYYTQDDYYIDPNNDLSLCLDENYYLGEDLTTCTNRYNQLQKSSTLVENALNNCNMDKEFNTSKEFIASLILLIFGLLIVFMIIYGLLTKCINNKSKHLKSRKTRKQFPFRKQLTKHNKPTMQKNTTNSLKNWISQTKCFIWMEIEILILNRINWNEYFLWRQTIKNIIWQNKFITLLKSYILYTKTQILLICHHISLFTDKITLGPYFKLKEELYKNQAQLFILQDKYENIQNILISQKRKICLAELKVKALEKENNTAYLRNEELYEQHNFLKEHHQIVICSKDEVITNQNVKINTLQQD
eukprot:146786_1